MLDEGLKKTDITARLGVSRGSIYHWLRTGQLDRELDDLPTDRTRVSAPSRLAPYKAIIDARQAPYPELSAVRLLVEVRAAGYADGLSQLQAYVRRVRLRAPFELVIGFETPPGHQAQVDFVVPLPVGEALRTARGAGLRGCSGCSSIRGRRWPP